MSDIDYYAVRQAVQQNANKNALERKHIEAERDKAEKAYRDIATDRDRWKNRALIAEAALSALGVQQCP